MRIEAETSVRIMRPNDPRQTHAHHLVVGFDGADSAAAIVSKLKNRSWSPRAEVALLYCIESLRLNAIMRQAGAIDLHLPWIRNRLSEASAAWKHSDSG